MLAGKIPLDTTGILHVQLCRLHFITTLQKKEQEAFKRAVRSERQHWTLQHKIADMAQVI